MESVKIGVIGCGSISIHRHIPEYFKHANAQLVAFCDVDEQRAQAAALEYGGQVYTDWRELLQQEELDAVSVCTPNVDHAPITIAALQAGKHVLCEKPMATSKEEAQAMVEAAKQNGVQLMIGHNQRLMPPHVKAKEILKSGKLGRVLTFRTAFSHGGPEGWSVDGADSWFFRKERAFVGALGDLGVHKVDLLRWLLEDEVIEVAAFTDTLEKKGDVEDNAVMLLRTRSGAFGTLAASWTHHPSEDNSTVIYGEKGYIRIVDDPVHQVIVYHVDGTVEKVEMGGIATNDDQTDSGVISAFVDAIVGGTPNPIPGEEGMKSLEVVLAAVEAAEKKTVVTP
ncbi:Gfo/Idh/MocA family protein [Desmospora activa]|uniref:Putative dehydrogenase n=1 Tax=Desmospora activa DSM 45169 TaxID=1121389 RepID=A0A2T4ZDH4_9BACL|nr:Gfo/Idh/MocA family oxidoreductase [Desmospora activa]PTM59944.1 putative dehydrogenase [Desmospora activa DSM 45169]